MRSHASIEILQAYSRPEPFEISVGKARASVSIDGRRERSFAVRRVDVLTRAAAEELVKEARASRRRIMIAFERSSPEARAYLRDRRASYAAADGEVFLYDPPLYVERPPRRKVVPVGPAPAAPFANRASRVPRWLLLHATEQPSFRELATRLELSEAMVSRTMRALADDGLVAIGSDPADARRRLARLRSRRCCSTRSSGPWRCAGRGASRGRSAHAMRPMPSGRSRRRLASSTCRTRSVGWPEPRSPAALSSQSTFWSGSGRDDAERWADELTPITSRPAPGRVTMQLTRDPFVLSLASDRDGIQVADPVQLYLDCRSAGERALEAADAIRVDMRW